MPEVSRFYGIVIRIFYEEHNPPHVHAEYGDKRFSSTSRHMRKLVFCEEHIEDYPRPHSWYNELVSYPEALKATMRHAPKGS